MSSEVETSREFIPRFMLTRFFDFARNDGAPKVLGCFNES